MKFFVDCVRALGNRFDRGDNVRSAAVAGAVAVDMLAVSAFLKNVLLPNNQNPPIASYFRHEFFDFSETNHRLEFLNVFADLAIFAVIIFFVVCFWVLVAQLFGKAAREYTNAVIFLRIAEPFVIFFILAGILRITAESLGGLAPQFINEFAVDFVFAAIVVLSLLLANGIPWRELKEIFSRRSSDKNSITVAGKAPSPWRDFKDLAPALWTMLIVLIVVAGVMWTAYATNPGLGTHNHLIEATGYIAWIIVAITIAILYVPVQWMDGFEKSETKKLQRIMEASPQAMWLRLFAITLAFGAFSALNFIVFGPSIETGGLSLWCAYTVLGWAFFDLRRWRFALANHSGKTSRRQDADFAELITAVGLASSSVAILVSFVVKRLIA